MWISVPRLYEFSALTAIVCNPCESINLCMFCPHSGDRKGATSTCRVLSWSSCVENSKPQDISEVRRAVLFVAVLEKLLNTGS